MASRVCTGCGRRVPADFDACLVCGSDIGNAVRVSSVATGLLPPAPPAYAADWPVTPRSPTDAPAGWLAPAAAGRPFTGAQEASRWLAAAGQGVVAILYTFSALDALSRLGGPGEASALMSLALRVLLTATFLRSAWRMVTQPDHRTLRSAIRLSLFICLLGVAVAVATDAGLIEVAVALVPGIASVIAAVAQRLLGDSIPDQVGADGWWR